ncbi:hypothetical protein [Amycolatopsis sp. Hca4]|uniref:hypothetical protein n=1 Tax=Amycolatopsis sp. Hca4 TaxID=2742131 RepID=UPI00158FC29C|nr:hypothetical protein [Amycolatopsis sp. Hca4]QKV80424.1 hypothetical protein HUT10_46565 [Amycolatopsis sp. Hca4]
MAHVSFTPTFHHTPWVDKIDRVEADGPNGFNTRFNAIGADLQQLSTVVKQTGAEVQQFQAPPPPRRQNRLLSCTPVFRKAPQAGKPWATEADGTAVARTNAIGGVYFGVMNLTLPGRFQLAAMRVKGIFVPDDIGEAFADVVLSRSPLQLTPGPPVVEQVAAFNVGATLTTTFDALATVTEAAAGIDPDGFRYFLTARFEMPDAVQLTTLMSIETIQLTLVPA